MDKTYPYGLNDKCNGRIWRNKNKEVAASVFNNIKCLRRKNRTRNSKKAWSQAFSFENFLAIVLDKYKTRGNWLIIVEKYYVLYLKKF